MIGVNLETRSIERGMIFTEQIRRKANEIAMQYCGWRTSYDMVDMFARLEEIGITVPVQENSGRNLNFQYKGRWVPGCILVFDNRNVDSENDRREYMVYFS